MARRRLGFWRRLAVGLVKPTMWVMTRRDWRGLEHIPQHGPAILVANHNSHADPLVLAHYVYDSGRWPGFLAKSSLFDIAVIGPLLKAVEQTPVYRGTADAAAALDAAVSTIKAGKVVIIYPEGTTTKEPDLWPMRGKTGVARLWLATGAPVDPDRHVGVGDLVRPEDAQAPAGTPHAGHRGRRPADRPVGLGGQVADRRHAAGDHRVHHADAAGHARRDPWRDATAAVDPAGGERRDQASRAGSED